MERKPSRLPWFFQPLWERIISAPVAVKIVGLASMPAAMVIFISWLYSEFYAFRPWQANPNTALSIEASHNLMLRGIFMAGVGALVGLAVSIWLTWLLIRQLSTLIENMRRVQTGDLTVRSKVWSRDEIGEVQAAFNTMVDGLEQSRSTLVKNQQQLENLNTEKNQLLAELTQKEIDLRRALRRAVEYQEEERKRISRELHDEIGQALTSILIRLKTIQGTTDLQVIADRINGIRYLTSQAIEEMRRLSMDLRPAALDNLGILPALRWYVGQIAEQSDIKIQFIGPERMDRLPPEVEIVLYRVAQEGLTNAIRHSHADLIEIKLECGPTSIWLDISDNGRGFDPAALDRGLGLVGIRERVDLLKGHCGIEAQPGNGARLWVELPISDRMPLDA